MPKQLKFLALGVILFILTTQTLWAKDYFLFDFSTNKILGMTGQETSFTEKFSLDQLPNQIISTMDPTRYLALNSPDEKNKKTGELILFDVRTQQSEKLADLGYYPYFCVKSKDLKDIYLAYCNDPQTKTYSLLHIDTSAMTIQKRSQTFQTLTGFGFSENYQEIYVLEGGSTKQPGQMLTIDPVTLEVKSFFSVGQFAEHFYLLGNNRMAILNRDLRTAKELGSSSPQNGSIKFIDMTNNQLITEKSLPAKDVETTWYPSEKTLMISVNQSYFAGMFGLKGKGEFIKVTADGLTDHEIKTGWIDYDYLPDLNRLYILSGNSFEVIDYAKNTVNQVKTDSNLISDLAGDYYICYLYHLPHSDYELIFCPFNGEVRFIDFTKNTVLKKITVGRAGRRLFAGIVGKSAHARITTNFDHSLFYILNQATNDITVLNNQLKQMTLITPKDNILSMYQVSPDNLQTIVTTDKNICRMGPDNTLIPICDFKVKPKQSALIEDHGRIIVLTDQEIVVLDAKNLTVMNQFSWYEKKSASKGDFQRYWFIEGI